MDLPNVVLLSVDSLRADYIGAVGGSSNIAPRINELADDSVIFERAYAQGCGTRRSMAALLTGAYPNMYGGISQIERPTLAGELRSAGYRTVGIHSNPYLSQFYGYDRGFDSFNGYLLPRNIGENTGNSRIRSYLVRIYRILNRTPYEPASVINRDIFSTISEYPDGGPLFLWAHYMDPHGPYQEKKSYVHKYISEVRWNRAIRGQTKKGDTENLERAYRAEVRRTDSAIGEVIDRLKQQGLYDDSYVIVCGDHGEGFDEHGFYGHPAKFYEEVLRVPLIIKPPSGVGGTRISEPVGLMHVPSTLLSRFGRNLPETFLGEDILENGPKGVESGVITEAFVEEESKLCITRSLDDQIWRLVLDEIQNRSVLRNLDKDPDEREKFNDDYPEVYEQLDAQLRNHLDRVKQNQTEYDVLDEPEIPESMQGRLKNLGYME